MTVPLQTPVSSATANGSATVFPYSFKTLDADDLSITLDGVEQTSGFTVSGVGNDLGGDVTFSVAPADGTAVVIALDPVLSRDEDYQQFGDWLAPTVNGDFDRLWLTLQKFANDFKRALKLPVDTATDQLLDYTAGERANALVTFDSSGNLTITPITSIAVNVSAGSFTVDTFDGDGATVDFTLSRDPGIINNTTVFVGGSYLRKDQYSISGTTLTFDVAPASGTANIEVCQSVALEAGAPADGTVTLASLVDGVLAATAAGLAKMADGFLAASTAGRAKMADKFVTLAKMADMATGKLLGNVSGVTGAPAEIDEASQAEAEAGTLQTRWMTPLRTAQAITAQAKNIVQSKTGTGGVTSAGAVLSIVFGAGDIIPHDDTIPQNTEGEAVLDATITTRAGTSLFVRLVLPLASGGGAPNVAAAIFVDSDAGAVAATTTTVAATNYYDVLVLEHEITGLPAGSHTIYARFGPSTAATVVVNGTGGGTRLFGGVSGASLTLTEV